MRFAGTCSRYSKNAMPQLTSAATYQGRTTRLLRCAYQAKVMKTFEPMSSRVAGMTEDAMGLGCGNVAQSCGKSLNPARSALYRCRDARNPSGRSEEHTSELQSRSDLVC